MSKSYEVKVNGKTRKFGLVQAHIMRELKHDRSGLTTDELADRVSCDSKTVNHLWYKRLTVENKDAGELEDGYISRAVDDEGRYVYYLTEHGEKALDGLEEKYEVMQV